MTSIKIVKSKLTGFSSFKSEGHSGYSEAGTDIVCAAVSSVTELVINILESFFVDFKLDIREDSASVLCQIIESEANSQKKEIIENIVGGYAEYLKQLSDEYPTYLKCILTEK